MASIGRGFRLAKASWAVVRSDKELPVLPIFSFFGIIAVSVVFGLGMVGIGLPQQGQSASPFTRNRGASTGSPRVDGDTVRPRRGA